jgi:hypothetical protein
MGGYQVSDLTSNPNFPNNPSSVEVLDNFDAPYNVEDNYGSRVRGYFVAPETGDFRYVPLPTHLLTVLLSFRAIAHVHFQIFGA